MSITLNGITLPSDLEWSDEFDWTPVRQSMDRSLTGKLLIEEAEKVGGRPITLYGGQNACWVPRSTVVALKALLVANNTMTLMYHGTEYSVMWRHDETPIEANQVRRIANPGDNWKYTITLRLMEVGSG